MLRLRTAAVACLLPVLAATLAACGDDSGDVRVGDIVKAIRPGHAGKAKASILVPTGELKVLAGKPVDSLPADDTRDRTAYDAPEGATFVPVTWSFDGQRFAKIDRYLGATATPTVDLVAGSETYRLTPPPETGGRESFYVAVTGDTSDLRLRVTYDEVAQTVDLRTGKRKAGAAAGLYDLGRKPSAPEGSCTATIGFKMPDASVEQSCKVSGPLFLPYAAGQWAAKGHRLLAVDVRTRLQRISQQTPKGGAWWYGASVRTTLTAAGDQPTATIPGEGDASVCPDPTTAECRNQTVAIFDLRGKSTPKRVLLTQVYRLEHGPTWGGYEPPDSQKVTAAGGIRLPRP